VPFGTVFSLFYGLYQNFLFLGFDCFEVSRKDFPLVILLA